MNIIYELASKFVGDEYAAPLTWPQIDKDSNDLKRKQILMNCICYLLQKIDDRIIFNDMDRISFDETISCKSIQDDYKCRPISSSLVKRISMSYHGNVLHDEYSGRYCILAKDEYGNYVLFMKRGNKSTISKISCRLSIPTMFEVYKFVLELILHPYMVRAFKLFKSQLEVKGFMAIPWRQRQIYLANANKQNWLIMYNQNYKFISTVRVDMTHRQPDYTSVVNQILNNTITQTTVPIEIYSALTKFTKH